MEEPVTFALLFFTHICSKPSLLLTADWVPRQTEPTDHLTGGLCLNSLEESGYPFPCHGTEGMRMLLFSCCVKTAGRAIHEAVPCRTRGMPFRRPAFSRNTAADCCCRAARFRPLRVLQAFRTAGRLSAGPRRQLPPRQAHFGYPSDAS